MTDQSKKMMKQVAVEVKIMAARTLGQQSRRLSVVILFSLLPVSALAQTDSGVDSAGYSGALPVESKRILGIIPNYRTSPPFYPYEPISPKEKFTLASEDALDGGTFGLAAVFAGEAQLTRANPSFGQDFAGFSRYFGTSYADYAIGDFMTEGIFPTVLHQDPRYFRKGSGSGWSRLAYAAGQIILTHSDRGNTAFNFSEILGNSTEVTISTAYYPDNRTASSALTKLVNQLAVDAAANILKEFWPERRRKRFSKHSEKQRTETASIRN